MNPAAIHREDAPGRGAAATRRSQILAGGADIARASADPSGTPEKRRSSRTAATMTIPVADVRHSGNAIRRPAGAITALAHGFKRPKPSRYPSDAPATTMIAA